jgi:predicted nucleic acid-binding protein
VNDAGLLTYADSCLLIDAYRGTGDIRRKAIDALTDPSRTFASSAFVRLEVLPGPTYHRIRREADFYQVFFDRAVSLWAKCDDALVQAAFDEAASNGVLGAVDALHVAAAAQLGCKELLTTERADKPVCRAKLVTVRSIR